MRIRSFIAVVGLCVGGSAISGLTSVRAQQKYLLWEGTYTAAQAERGKAAYAKHCSECHGADGKDGKATPLVGDLFMMHWESKSVEELFHKTRDTMPRGTPAAVSDKDKLDVLAYVLQQNGFPAGTADLTDDPRLATLQIMPKDGPSPPRNGSMVEATGCLEGQGSEWNLTNATPPRITSLSAPASGQQAANASTDGGVTVPLISVFPRPTAHVGHKMRAKGLFVKTAAGERINVTSLEMVAETCTP
jgi:S-disulfanyl-L-cysteine oxidoreductase SoxD